LPDLVGRLAARRRLWGCSAESLRAVRDPFRVARSLARRGAAMPRMREASDAPPADGSWLVKRRRSSGGFGVAVWRGSPATLRPDDAYFQQRLAGPSFSTVFVADGNTARFRGATRQYVGRFGAAPFHYCGSLGPLALSRERRAEWERIGAALAAAFGLVGVFGVDAVRHRGRLHVVDVNPRWPASAEVLEKATEGASIMGEHAAACREGRLPCELGPRRGVVGKAILFADRPFIADDRLTRQLVVEAIASAPTAADVPAAGTAIGAGEPICTRFVYGSSEGETARLLFAQAASFARRLSPDQLASALINESEK
ncbi:MAG TPA: ATP-grasp domain-containing protein, partial [Pirellulales bacterium]